MYIYEPLKKRLYPTIAEAKKAIQLADKTDEKDRDPRPLASISARLIDASSRLRGHILTRRMAVSAFDWRITATEEADTDRAREARRRTRRTIDKLIDWHTDTPLFGVSAVEVDWTTGGPDGTTPGIRKRYAPTELERNGDDPAMIRILDESQKPVRVAIGQPTFQNWLIDVDDSYERGGLLRSLIYDQILLAENKLEWANYNRKLKGLIQAIYEASVNDEHKSKALESLKKFVENNFTATDSRIDYKFHSMTDGKGSTSFESFMRMLVADAAIAILGQANTAELPAGGGSRAALQILNLVRADIYWSDMRRLERVVNDQLLAWDFQLNGGPPDATEAPWRFEFAVEEEDDPEGRARVIVDYVNAGIPIVEDDAYDTVGLTRPHPESKLLEVKAPDTLPI